VLLTSMALVHNTPGDLVRSIFLGNGVAGMLLLGLAVFTSIRGARRAVGVDATPQTVSASHHQPAE
jgi:hypothetical protein